MDNNIVDIEFYDRRSIVIKNRIKDIAKRIMKLLNINNSIIEITFVSQSEIRKINKKYRKKDISASVLSFQFKDFSIKNYDKNRLGEIFISNGYINKNKQNIEYILLHGILHLTGFDHIKIRDRIKMEKKEKEVMILLKKVDY